MRRTLAAVLVCAACGGGDDEVSDGPHLNPDAPAVTTIVETTRATIALPGPAAAIFASLGSLDTADTRGIDVVTTNWDDAGLTVLLDVDTSAPPPITLHVAAPPTGVAVGAFDGDAPDEVVWTEAWEPGSGETRLYVADLDVDPPAIRQIVYPFPQAHGGQLRILGGLSGVLVVADQTRDDPPQLLLSELVLPSIAATSWTTTSNLGDVPGATPRFALADYDLVAAEWVAGLVRFYADPDAFEIEDLEPSHALPYDRGTWASPVTTAASGFFTADGMRRTVVLLTADGRVLVWDPTDAATGFAGPPMATRAGGRGILAPQIDFDVWSDVVVLGDDGNLSVYVNDGRNGVANEQTFPLTPPCTTCILAKQFDANLLAVADETLVVFGLDPQ